MNEIATNMKHRTRALKLSGALVAFALAALFVAPTANAEPDHTDRFYVALGDSLATGDQPAASGELNRLRDANGSNRGYVDILHAAMRDKIPGLQLRNFGCGGESTTSLIEGGEGFDRVCGYNGTSQLAEAVQFPRAHQGEIAFVATDIGANDGPDGIPAIAANLPVILDAVRDAAGPGVPVVGMNYYDPYLAPVWSDTHDLGALQAEVDNIVAFNDFFESVYTASGVPVADVGAAFSVTNVTIQPSGLPFNVEQACRWTWICSVGDPHANDTGYQAIAQAFLQLLS
jgi:lysophospholipase L1-like esterase